MNLREQLIERIRAVRDDGYLSATYLGDERLGDLMGDILTVFEEAHAPTDHHVDHHDDELEALANLIPLGFSERDGVRNVYDAADRILAAGFHRTMQSEPSNVSKQGVSDISPTQMSVKGEPSDAQVLAALNAYYADYMIGPNKSLDDVRPPSIAQAMLAALRAAAAVQGGER